MPCERLVRLTELTFKDANRNAVSASHLQAWRIIPRCVPIRLSHAQRASPAATYLMSCLLTIREDAVSAALQARHNLLTAIARGLLQALSFCHQRGVAHCGLGCGSVVLNTWRDKEVGQLRVKLDNFGLARVYEHPLEPPEGVLGIRRLHLLMCKL